jgi:hypothetical protein
MKFTESAICQGRKKCHLCRADNRIGEGFRVEMGKMFEMPGAGMFACPFDVEAVPLTVSALPPPVPRKQWPEWAKRLADDANDNDVGIGDTVERRIGPAASAAFKTWYRAVFKKTCGCEKRKAEWNARYPYRMTLPV